jgi:hypothetical protein
MTMRILLFILTASAASQLPARDAPQRIAEHAEVRLIHASEPDCRREATRSHLVLATGPTVFAPAGSIA